MDEALKSVIKVQFDWIWLSICKWWDMQNNSLVLKSF